MDWLVIWGVKSATGFFFEEVIAPLVKESLEECVKDFFSDSIEDLVDFARDDSLKKAFGQALKAFLELVQEELEEAELDREQIRQQYTRPLKKFRKHSPVLSTLGRPFSQVLSGEKPSLDTDNLQGAWVALGLQSLPPKFDWSQLDKRYCRKVRSIVRDSEELRELLNAENLDKIREQLSQLTPILPDFDFGRYQEGLTTAYGKLKLDSLDTSGCHYSLQLWKIFVPQDLREQSHPQQPLCSILDLLHPHKQYKYTVILGNPGSGKSTLTQYKALEWAKQPTSTVRLQEFPLLIELRNYAENIQKSRCQNFLDYFQQGTGVSGGNLNQKELHEWLTNRPAIVMFDGLDEVLDPAERENIVIDIINFSRTYPQAKILVTSRIVGYEPQRLRFAKAGFRHFLLQDLNETQIREFIEKWHNLAFQDNLTDGERKGKRLQDAIANSIAFRELAGNPLLLTMMAILNRRDVLPQDNITLYKEASAVLLQHWEADKYLPDTDRFDQDIKRLKTLDYQDKQEMLRQIARYVQTNASNFSGDLFIRRDELQTVLSDCLKTLGFTQSKIVAKSLQIQLTTRSFIVCFVGGDYYGFVHRTFLEFFCAWSWIWRFEKKREINEDELKNDLFRCRWQDESWHEVLSLVASDIDKRFAATLVEDLISQDGQPGDFMNLFLAVKCLCEARSFINIKEVSINKLSRELEELAEGRIAGMSALQEKARKALDKFRSLGQNGNRG